MLNSRVPFFSAIVEAILVKLIWEELSKDNHKYLK